jgi:hypothetical protein
MAANAVFIGLRIVSAPRVSAKRKMRGCFAEPPLGLHQGVSRGRIDFGDGGLRTWILAGPVHDIG